MGFIFDHDAARRQEAWFRTEAGLAAWRLQKELILRLIRPLPRERLLDVGCGSGLYFQLFKREGLDVTGVDPSPAALDLARGRLGWQAALFPGRAEDLPFEDNEFDIVTLITCLEFVDDPEAALAEALRVARSRIFIGALNSLSLTALGRRVRGLFKDSLYNRARFFSLWELTGMIRRLAGPAPIEWATAQVLPPGLAWRVCSFEARPAVQSSPFGAFLGLVAQIVYTTRTSNLTLTGRLRLAHKPSPMPTTFQPAGCGGKRNGRSAAV